MELHIPARAAAWAYEAQGVKQLRAFQGNDEFLGTDPVLFGGPGQR
jgi:hypothetical protein